MRRETEAKEGIDTTMYPHVTDNREGQGIDIPGEETIPEDEEKTGKPKDRDKLDDKDKFDVSIKELEGAPYSSPSDLPPSIKNNLSPGLQSTFIEVFNNAYEKYGETRAFRIAWSVIKKIAKKGKDGKWVRKSSRTKLNRAMVEEVLQEEEKQVIDETIKTKQIALLDKLLGKDKQKEE